ncbi:MAG: hypothetical protein JXL80_00115 [Planctomycetes bacterium]|nr:hypothetical protein [Planctomycetota bacterium]
MPADSIRRHADDPLSQSIRTLRQQYHLSTAARLDALCRTADQQTQLTDEQRQRISAVNETISRRADDALREVRAEQANLKARAASLGSGAAADATQAAEIRRQLMDLVARELQIAGELDRQYMEMMSRELTPEQMRVLTGQPKPEDEPEVRPPPVQWIPPEEAEALRQHPAASDNE